MPAACYVTSISVLVRRGAEYIAYIVCRSAALAGAGVAPPCSCSRKLRAQCSSFKIDVE